MARRSSVIQQIRADYQHLQSHIGLLKSVLSQADVDSISCVHPLPEPDQQDIGADYQYVSVDTLAEKPAVERYLLHLSNMRLSHNRVGQMSVRLPGCIVIKSSEESEIRERIDVINQLKQKLDTYIQHNAGKNKDDRFELVKDAVPNLVRKALARKILLAPANTTHVSYTWSQLMSQSKALPREVWDEKLQNAILVKRNHPSAEEWAKAISIERKALQDANDTNMFRIKRPLRVSPCMNVRYLNETGDKKKTTYNAHTPLLVINACPALTPLKDYDGDTKRILGGEAPVIERLHLYRA